MPPNNTDIHGHCESKGIFAPDWPEVHLDDQ